MVLPTDVWLKIMEESGTKEVLRFAQCCKALRELAKSRSVWLELLYRLEQHEAPSLPPHIPVSTYDAGELRRIVTHARKSVRRRQKGGKDCCSLDFSHVVEISLDDSNPDEVLGETRVFGIELLLLPGGKQLLVLWPAGYIQLWDISKDKPRLVWLYPDYPKGLSEDRPLLVSNLHYEMQEDGDIHIALVNDLLQDELLGERYIDIVRLSPESDTVNILRSGKRDFLEREYGPVEIVRIQGDILVIYQEFYVTMMGALTISLWRKGLSLTLTNAALDSVEFAEDHLLCVRRDDDGKKSIAVISVEDVIRRLLEVQHQILDFEELVSLEHPLEYDSFAGKRAVLSVCTYHWKPKTMRDKVYVTVTADTRRSLAREGIFIAHFMLYSKGLKTNAKPSLTMLDTGSWKFARPDERVPHPNSLVTDLEVWSTPGYAPIIFHSVDQSVKEDKLALASLSYRHDMTLETYDLDVGSIALTSIRTEFYSGSLVYATKNYDAVIARLLT